MASSLGYGVGCSTATDASVESLDSGSLDSGTSDAASSDTATPVEGALDSSSFDDADDSGGGDAASEDASPDDAGDASGQTCGGVAGAACAVGTLCKTKDGQCSVPDAVGTCEPIPVGCTEEHDPVCGCDGATYGNRCEAARAGVNVAHTGECTPEGEECGGKKGATCAPSEYCDYADEAMCGVFDATGICRARPVGCPLDHDPVCGCDGNTYGNDCLARAAGVDVRAKGECP